MRRPVIAGNWKMYKTQAEARAFMAKLLPLVAASHHCDIEVTPPFTALAATVEAAKGSKITVAAQNAHREKEGAFTALTGDDFSRVLLAYEPCWAIGTGRTATPEMAADAHRYLRELAHKRFSTDRASALRILYGG